MCLYFKTKIGRGSDGMCKKFSKTVTLSPGTKMNCDYYATKALFTGLK